MYSLGFDWEAVDFFSFIADIADSDDDLQIMYGIGGERELDGVRARPPARLRRLAPGARSATPRTPSSQHDVWGALLDSVYLHSKAVDHLDNRIWPILDKQVGEALKHWREPDAGHLGGARRAAALHLVQDHVLGGRRPRLPGSPG